MIDQGIGFREAMIQSARIRGVVALEKLEG
jgi:hypothetical protein